MSTEIEIPRKIPKNPSIQIPTLEKKLIGQKREVTHPLLKVVSIITPLMVGLIFAIGLGLGGMTAPENVQGFLDIFGEWNPKLLFVMMGAILVHAPFYHFVMKKRTFSVFFDRVHLPLTKELTPRLMIGASVFGVGWGLAGYCPGPALVSSASGSKDAIVFVLSMLVGMMIFRQGMNFYEQFTRKNKKAHQAEEATC